MGTNVTAPDDDPFAGITGIGSKRAAALVSAGVKDRADLASVVDPDQLIERLRAADQRSISSNEVRRWIEQARKLEADRSALSETHASDRLVPPEGSFEGFTLHGAAFTIFFGHRPAAAGVEWRSVVYDEAGAGKWSELLGAKEWAGWIETRLRTEGDDSADPGNALDPPPEALPSESAPTPPGTRELELETTTAAQTLGRSQHGIAVRLGLRPGPHLLAAARGGALEYWAEVQLDIPDAGSYVAREVAQGVLSAAGEHELLREFPFPPPGRYAISARARVWSGEVAAEATSTGPDIEIV